MCRTPPPRRRLERHHKTAGCRCTQPPCSCSLQCCWAAAAATVHRGRDRPRRRRLCPQRGQEPGVRVYARHCQPAQAQRGTPPPHLHPAGPMHPPFPLYYCSILYPRAEALEHPKDRPRRSRDRAHARPRAAGRRPVGRRAHRQGVCGIAPHAPHASHITRRSFRVLTLAPLPTSVTLAASRPVHRSARPCRAPRSPPSRTASPASSTR